MKSVFANKFFILLCIAVLTAGCEKVIHYEGITGDLRGRVKGKNTYLKDVLVTIAGASDSLRTLTNEEGLFIFEGLKTGIYDIVFSNDSFATFKLVSFQFIGGNIPTYTNPVTLYKLPIGQITNIIVHVDSTSMMFYNTASVIISGTTSDMTDNYSHAQYYISDQPNVSSSDYKITNLISIDKLPGDTAFTYIINFNMKLSSFEPGAKLYIIFYSATSPYSTDYSYLDIETGNLIYTNISNQGSNVAD